MKFPKEKNYKKILLQAGAFGMLALWLANFNGCAMNYGNMASPMPQSAWGDKYAYSYNLPSDMKTKAPGSVPVTIAVVNPSYKEEDSALGKELFIKVGKGLSGSMGVDLDKILIAKGVTTTGPYPSLDEITYSQKKDASLTLAPKVFITVEMKALGDPTWVQGANRTEQAYAMSVTGWISFIMQEPLSGQKMWIKKLELDPIQKQGVVHVEKTPRYGSDGCGGQIVVGYNDGGMVFDGRVDSLADALKEIYPMILSQFYKYIDTDELLQLKEKSKEIRALKVY